MQLTHLAAQRSPLALEAAAAPRATSSPNLNTLSPHLDALDGDDDDGGQSDSMDSLPPHCQPALPYDTNR